MAEVLNPRAPTLAGPGFLLLLGAGLAVSMSYGVTLPLLPAIVLALQPGDFAGAARHTGWLTAAYTAALFVFSPVWGALSDRIQRRWVILIGLAGAGVSLWLLEQAPTLALVYASRIVAGALAAAVLPAVFAYVVETTVLARRQRRFAWIASATALGFLLGPAAGTAAAALGGRVTGLELAGLLCVGLAIAAMALPAVRPLAPAGTTAPGTTAPAEARCLRDSLLLTGVVVFGITVAEVGLTLYGGPVTPYFALCSAVMVATQLVGYPLLERWLGEPRLVLASLAVMSLGVTLLAWSAPWTPAVSFLLAAGALGVLIPALAVRISAAAGARQGRMMGAQAGAANLGQAAGAALTGVLFTAWAPAPFVLAGLLLLAGTVLAAAARRSTPGK